MTPEPAASLHVVVIGGGVGGYAAALKAARRGARVTLVERDRIGGVCLNRGCIPTKVLLHATDLLHEASKAELFGLATGDVRIDLDRLKARKDAIVGKLRQGVLALLQAGKVRVVNGTASFVDKRTIRIADTGETLDADCVIVATGSEPARLRIEGVAGGGLPTSDDLLEPERIPGSMLVIGGGYIGVELGQFYSRAGASVTIVEQADRLVPTEDDEIAKALEASLDAEGIAILTGAAVKSVSAAGGAQSVVVETKAGPRTITADIVAQAIGRRPSFAALVPEKAGVETRDGAIAVDDGMRTSAPGIYAVGDVAGGVLLAHVAIAEAECAVDNALGGASRMSYRAVPRCIYTSPEVACVGLTERQARADGRKVDVARLPLHAVGKALIVDGQGGMVKIVADGETGELLGMHIIGPHATELISEAVLAIGLECTAEEIARTIHPHPTVAEGIGEAAMMLAGGALHMP